MKKIFSEVYNINDIHNLCLKIIKLLSPFITSSSKILIGLKGDLGAGKTSFSRALLTAYGVKELVNSPTYSLENIYKVNFEDITVNFRHWDLYRIKFFDEIFEEIIENSNPKKSEIEIILIEWFDKFPIIHDELELIFEFEQLSSDDKIGYDEAKNYRRISLFSRK